jgi:iron complex outermembrane receptor protein
MKPSRRAAASLVASTVAALLGTSAVAQAQDSAELQEVLVLAKKLGAGEGRATFVLDAADIQQRPLGSDVMLNLARVPGVQVSTGDARGGSFSFELYLRGLNKEQIGLTLDGIPTGDARFNGGSPPQRFIESSNIANVVVSQSAGDIGAPSRFALGGFVNFITADPAETAGVIAELGAGSESYRRYYLRADTGRTARGLSAMLSASHQQNDIWAGPNSRSSERDHVEFKLVQEFEGGSSVKARVSWNDQTDNDFNIVTLGEFLATPDSDRALDAITGIPARDIDFGGALGGTRKDVMAYLNATWQVNDGMVVTLNPYYQTLDGESFRYQDRQRKLTGVDPRAVTGYGPTGGAVRPAVITTRNSNVLGGPADMRVTPRDRDRYGVTSELKIGTGDSRHTFRVGAWFEGGDSSEKRNFYPITNSAQGIDYDRRLLNYVEYERSTTIETTMLYAQDSIRLIPDVLRLDLGVTWFDVSYKAASPLEYKPVVAFSQNSSLNPKIALSWNASDSVEVFGGLARNFAGIPEDAFLGSTAVIAPGDLDPIETENVDLGVRYSADNYALSMQLYSLRLKNNIGIVPRDPTVVDPDEIVRGNVATRAANIRGVETRGIELTAIADLGRVKLYGAYSWQDAKHDDPAPGSIDYRNLAAVGVIAGQAVRDIPRHSLYGQLDIELLTGLSLGLTGRYVGERVGGHIVAPNTFAVVGVEKIPGYSVFGASLKYALPSIGVLDDATVQFNVDNLFDKDYIGAVTSATATQPEFGILTGPAIRTLDRYFIGAPRTWTLSLQAKF